MSTPSKATAIAHPIQGIVKYHGLRDPVRRIPFHDSISVCTGPIGTKTTFEVRDDGDEQIVIDGELATGRSKERARMVVDAVREHVADERPYHAESRNDFPQFVGLGSSSSGFAALALAAARAYGWDADLERLSQIARLGAGSACRAIVGGVSEWLVEQERSHARSVLPADDLDWSIVVPLVRHEEPTENVHREVLTSPLFDARVDAMTQALSEARAAIAARDLPRLWAVAEADTLNLHAITMTGTHGHLTWQPATVAVIHTVRRLRKDGIPVWFSIDTGATAYLNTPRAHADAVAGAVQDIDGVAEVMRLAPAGPARLVDEHLF